MNALGQALAKFVTARIFAHFASMKYSLTFISSKNISKYGITKSTDVTCLHGFSNAIFGDRENCGKFLIELRDEVVQSAIGISHFISLDTDKLEIYDPMSTEGAIVTQRSSRDDKDMCLFLEYLKVLIMSVWIQRS
jgi:hypothetical protein